MRIAIIQLDAIAQILHLSPRVLQRKLKEAGTSYQILWDKAGYELTLIDLQKPQIADPI